MGKPAGQASGCKPQRSPQELLSPLRQLRIPHDAIRVQDPPGYRVSEGLLLPAAVPCLPVGPSGHGPGGGGVDADAPGQGGEQERAASKAWILERYKAAAGSGGSEDGDEVRGEMR